MISPIVAVIRHWFCLKIRPALTEAIDPFSNLKVRGYTKSMRVFADIADAVVIVKTASDAMLTTLWGPRSIISFSITNNRILDPAWE